MSETIKIPTPIPGQRRQFSVEQKRALILESQAPGSSLSQVARCYGIAPSLLFKWSRAMANGESKGLQSGEDVVPVSELTQAHARIRELERLLGKKTVENEILQEAVRIAREKKLIAPAKLPKRGNGG